MLDVLPYTAERVLRTYVGLTVIPSCKWLTWNQSHQYSEQWPWLIDFKKRCNFARFCKIFWQNCLASGDMSDFCNQNYGSNRGPASDSMTPNYTYSFFSCTADLDVCNFYTKSLAKCFCIYLMAKNSHSLWIVSTQFISSECPDRRSSVLPSSSSSSSCGDDRIF